MKKKVISSPISNIMTKRKDKNIIFYNCFLQLATFKKDYDESRKNRNANERQNINRNYSLKKIIIIDLFFL